jgi:hypothetical protein
MRLGKRRTQFLQVIALLLSLGPSGGTFDTRANSLTESTTTFEFRIPSQDLGRALSALAKTAGVNVLVSPDANVKQPARALYGTFTVTQALDILLADAGLRFEYSDRKTILVLRRE